jgi:arsenate reductase-like glutaredoxin family protein
VPIQQQQDAKKATLTRRDALRLASEASEIYAAKGKSVVHIDLKKDKPDEESLAKVLLGPTGNLRAPTLRIGKKLIVGFEPEMYRRLLGNSS